MNFTWKLPDGMAPARKPWTGPTWTEVADGRIMIARLYEKTARDLGIEIEVYEKFWFLASKDDAVRIRGAYIHPHVQRARDLERLLRDAAIRHAFAAREWVESERGKRQIADHHNIVALLDRLGAEVPA